MSLEKEIGLINELSSRLGDVEAMIGSFSTKPRVDVTQHLTDMQTAQLNFLISYTINSLYFTLLKVSGHSSDTHRIRLEIENLQIVHEKLKKAKLSEQSTNLTSQREHGRGNGNESVAHRMILQHLGRQDSPRMVEIDADYDQDDDKPIPPPPPTFDIDSVEKNSKAIEEADLLLQSIFEPNSSPRTKQLKKKRNPLRNSRGK